MTDSKALIERLREVGRDGVWKSGRNRATAHPMCIEAADAIGELDRHLTLSGKVSKMISLLFVAVGWLAGYEYGIRRRK